MSPRVTAKSVSSSENLLAIGRFGVGYDSVDVRGLHRRRRGADHDRRRRRSLGGRSDGGLDARPDASRPRKDRLVREARWHERQLHGPRARDRTLGIVGMGGIGRALVELLRGLRHAPDRSAFDPYLDPAIAAASMGVGW